jgi:hypothetical protein
MRLLHSSGPQGPGGLEPTDQVRYTRAWSLLGLLLTPVSVAAGALAAWRFGVDVGWTSAFFIAGGFLSHWQVWCAFAISAEVCACSLRRAAVAQAESGISGLGRVRVTL